MSQRPQEKFWLLLDGSTNALISSQIAIFCIAKLTWAGNTHDLLSFNSSGLHVWTQILRTPMSHELHVILFDPCQPWWLPLSKQPLMSSGCAHSNMLFSTLTQIIYPTSQRDSYPPWYFQRNAIIHPKSHFLQYSLIFLRWHQICARIWDEDCYWTFPCAEFLLTNWQYNLEHAGVMAVFHLDVG